jgi:tRNA dimethylallyltransferase
MTRPPLRAADGRPILLAVVGPTATGKSALALAVAEAVGGEIVSCDSTAVYRGFDIGTDKVPVSDRRGIPHHLVDVADPLETYTAARYSQDAGEAVRAVTARGRLPILVGGTGFYYRALTRGLFPGPARDPALRARLSRVAHRRGVESLHRWLARCDPASAQRVKPRDEQRLVRALEVWLLTGRTLTDHFADTRSPIADYEVLTVALALDHETLESRIARRVGEQFASGLLEEIVALWATGLAPDAAPFRGLVYRQAVEHLQGVRDAVATRALIIRENRRYARRQLIWFRKEPNLHWIHAPGEDDATYDATRRLLEAVVEPLPLPFP